MKSTAPTRKPGRPLSFDRQAALKQAMLTFWQHGYETTSINDLTAAMGISAPSLYTAFGDKQQLFLESTRLYATAPEDLQRQLDQAPTAQSAARAMLYAAAHGFTGTSTPRGCLLASATASGSSTSQAVQHAVAAIRQDIITRLTARIAQDITSGALPPTAAATSLAAMVVAVIQGMSVLARDGSTRESLLGIADCALTCWPA